MSFDCKVIADSIWNTKRITTLECTYPRFIHAEIMTHRDRARNAGSSRAIPWRTMCERITNNAVVPIYWGSERKGMQTGGQISEIEEAQQIWLEARDNALRSAQQLADLGVHKSLCNRLTEPFMWITIVMTATNWRNFFKQRCHPDAEIHMQKIAEMMRYAIDQSTPTRRSVHLPYVEDDEEWPTKAFDPVMDMMLKVSTARCARVSYVQHGSKVKSIDKDLELGERLLTSGHWSPFEHPCLAHPGRSGCFDGWKSYRKNFPEECPQVEGYLECKQ